MGEGATRGTGSVAAQGGAGSAPTQGGTAGGAVVERRGGGEARNLGEAASEGVERGGGNGVWGEVDGWVRVTCKAEGTRGFPRGERWERRGGIGARWVGGGDLVRSERSALAKERETRRRAWALGPSWVRVAA
ncbi:hypothetical protein ZWY2020_055781 [Hordeum vulgare]|nr:hypothetical protein ZWY2020_055781 [Hordeum vulgare]